VVYHISLECIGDDGGVRGASGALAAMIFGKQPSRAWVAKVKYIRGKYIQREFVQGKKDYTNSNSVGSRGIYKHYFLDDGLYEISDPKSWKQTDRYFAYIEAGELWRVTKEEAELWLNDNSESMS